MVGAMMLLAWARNNYEGGDLYVLEEKYGKKRPIVTNPYNCVVLCTGCDSICPAGAISHPTKKKTKDAIKNLRKTYSLHNPKNRSKNDK